MSTLNNYVTLAKHTVLLQPVNHHLSQLYTMEPGTIFLQVKLTTNSVYVTMIT